MTAQLDVSIVIPVYNEQDCIRDVLEDWLAELRRLNLSFTIIALNDGSRDKTAEKLSAFADTPGITYINKENSGHGPTILQGYRRAVTEARWVFQVDSDNEMEACHFEKVWTARNKNDAVIGIRDGRAQPPARKIVSMISRGIVSLFYGSGIKDVNCPFRLMHSDSLREFLALIPDNTFAPNVALSGLFALHRKKIVNIPIPHRDRQTGEVSIKKWKLLKAAASSCLQTIKIRFLL